jgi:hypothetical protein
MARPDAAQYFEAIQDPHGCFQDADLRRAEPALNKLGVPILYSGNFAAVFQVLGSSPRQRWVVKCFTREVPGLQQRYQAISAHLHQADLSFMVDFHYLEQGIRIGNQWYPVLKMDWVEGVLLNQFVETYLDKPATLNQLAELWLKLARGLRRAGIAHGDLQHGNVLLVPGRKATALALRLIDYDGMFVPALAGNKPVEKGHPNYQHPQRLREGTYNTDVDRFSHLVVYTALRCLAVGGRALWQPAYENGENLLFREEDFRAPASSALLRELWGLPDPGIRALVRHLVLASQGALEEVPLLDELAVNGSPRAHTPVQEGRVAAWLGPAAGRVDAAVALPAAPPLAVAAGIANAVAVPPPAPPLALPATLAGTPLKKSRRFLAAAVGFLMLALGGALLLLPTSAEPRAAKPPPVGQSLRANVPMATRSPESGRLFGDLGKVIKHPDDPALEPEALTVEAWVYPTEWPFASRKGLPFRCIISKNPWLSEGHYALVVENHRVAAVVTLGHAYFARGQLDDCFLNAWHHLAMTCDGATLKLYCDGELAALQPITGPRPPPLNPSPATGRVRPAMDRSLYVGCINGSDPRGCFQGRLDDIRIYSRALSAEEIRAHCEVPAPIKAETEKGLIRHWSF